MNETPAIEPLTRDQVLDQLAFLAEVEHALIVEYLSVSCALGCELEAVEGGGTSSQGREASKAAARLAETEMRHLKNICNALVEAERTPTLGRASSITSAAGDQVPLDPPTVDQLRDLLRREHAITSAVDDAYARLAPALTPALFEEGLLERLRGVVEVGAGHAGGTSTLRNSLGDPPPPDFLRVARRDTDDPFENRLLTASDKSYRVVSDALRAQFSQPEVFGFMDLARTAMDALDASNKALARCGLLPAFTL